MVVVRGDSGEAFSIRTLLMPENDSDTAVSGSAPDSGDAEKSAALRPRGWQMRRSGDILP